MARKTGRFLDKRSVVSADDEQVGQLSVPGAEVIEIKQESWASIIYGWFKGLLGFVLLLAIIGAGLFTGLGMTVLNYVPLNPDSANRSIVLRGAWAETGGVPPIGTKVAISETTLAPTSAWWEWVPISWVGIENPSTVEIVSKNYDRLYVTGTVEDAKVTILDNPSVTGKFAPNQNVTLEKYKENTSFEENVQLKDSYLVKCVSGSCEKDTYFVAAQGQIYGEVR